MAEYAPITCNLPPPTATQCASIPICSDSDLADISGNGLCSTLEMHSSCLPGFMFMDPKHINASRPLSLASISPFTQRSQLQITCYNTMNNASLIHECASKCYPYTQACCAGHYCPLSRACMIPCTAIGSYCPSSNMLSIKSNACYPLNIPKFGPSMGCGGAIQQETICPRSYYCPTSDELHQCPAGHFCRAGDNAPTKCSPLMRCGVATADPSMSYVAVMLLCILILYLLLTLGYKWIRYLFGISFERIYGETYAEWFESNQNSKLIQYLGRVRLSLSASKSTSYASVKKSIKTAFVSTEGDVTVQMVDAVQVLPQQLTKDTDGTDIIDVAMDDDEEEEVKAVQTGDNVQNNKCTSRVLLNENSAIKFTMDVEFGNLTMKLKSNNRIIVNNVSGRLPAGTITAIMGPSGSGKSSFLSALRNQAPFAKISGDIKINGELKLLNDFADVVGYVPQNDIMSPWLTPREVLQFQADLRLSRQHESMYKKCVVKDVLELLDIYEIRDSKIGDDKKRGISGGQKKRVNIGMELVAQPSILFLDEPTSGLDATTSSKVMTCLKNIAKQGVTILVVIHQPRFDIFKDFDNLILLTRGGKNVFVGKRQDVIPYFESLGYHLNPNTNPADFILDVIQGEHDEKNQSDSAFSYKLLPEIWETKRMQYEMAENESLRFRKSCNSDYKSRKTASWITQSYMVMRRGVRINTRQRMTILSHVIMIVVAGFITGWMSDTTKMTEVPHLVHGVILASSLCGSMISLRAFGEDRLQYYRYKRVGISSISYFVGQTVAEAPWIIFEPLLLLFFLWPVCFPRGDVFDWFFILALGMFVCQGLAQMISVAVDKAKSPLINVVAVLVICFMNGMNPTLASMHESTVTGLIIDASFARWQFEALWIKELESWPLVFNVEIGFQQKFFGFDINNYRQDIMMLLIFGTVFRIITFILLRFKG